MPISFLWPLLMIVSAGLQIIRNAAQRELTAPLGLWGATYVRFLFGLPFAVLWALVIVVWRGADSGPNLLHFSWSSLGGACQAVATALLLVAMQGRAFAVANALQKIEVMGAALVGLAVLGDHLGAMQWAGMIIASIGVTLVALAKNEDANQRASVRAAMFGIGAGFLFSISSLAYRAAGHAWGGDLWVGAAATLVTALSVQTLAMGAALLAFSPSTLRKVARARRASLVPGATGAIASACLFTAFALGPSAGAVKAVQLIDVVMAWGVSRRVFREPIAPRELIGGALTLIGILGVVLWQ